MPHEMETTSNIDKTSVPWTVFDVALFVVLLVVAVLMAFIVAAIASQLQGVFHPHIEQTVVLFAIFLPSS